MGPRVGIKSRVSVTIMLGNTDRKRALTSACVYNDKCIHVRVGKYVLEMNERVSIFSTNRTIKLPKVINKKKIELKFRTKKHHERPAAL